MRIVRLFSAVSVLIFASAVTWGQPTLGGNADTGEATVSSIGVTDRLSLALSTPDYPVTPGDTISIAYLGGTGTAALTEVVHADYTLDLGFFGSLQTRGRTFLELKREVSDLVKRIYPNSYPRVNLVRVGMFHVSVSGAVERPGNVPAWGLERLSDVVDPRIADYGSARRIELVRSDGSTLLFDLYLAERNGDLGQDPRLRPGDEIVVPESETRITLAGQVYRPGAYEILPNENLERIVEYYGGGLTPQADPGKLSINRFADNEASIIVVDFARATGRSRTPLNGDVITAPALSSGLPVVYLEGAVSNPNAQMITEGTATDATDEARRVRIPILAGDTLYSVLSRSRTLLAESADLTRTEVRREGVRESIAIDLERLLYGQATELDIDLVPGDRIIVPTGFIEVFVFGEVIESGFFDTDPLVRLDEFLKNRTTPYASTRRVRIASRDASVRIYDLFAAKREGRVDQNPYLQPGDRIEVLHLDREVSVRGDVERPGSYELLPGEGLRDLIDRFGGGVTGTADRTRVEISRTNTGSATVSERIAANLEDVRLPTLRNQDIVDVPSTLDLQSSAYLEGAVRLATDPTSEAAAQQDVERDESSATIRVPVREGESLYSAIHPLLDRFDDRANLANTELHRADGSPMVRVDLESLLFQARTDLDLPLLPGDRIIVPFGTFTVFASGQVERSGRFEVDSLTRLSGFVAGRLTSSGSVRGIEITHSNGESEEFDLFLAERFGRLEHDPLLRPDDRIFIGRINRRVEIAGEVSRPGSYELMPGDDLERLIEYYGDRATDLADLTRVEITRSAAPGGRSIERMSVDYIEGEELNLANYDRVRIPSRTDLLPVVYLEGAIVPDEITLQLTSGASSGSTPAFSNGATTESTAAQTSGGSSETAGAPGGPDEPDEPERPTSYRMRLALRSGETLYSVLDRAESRMDQRGDLRRGFIRRDGVAAAIPIDMERLFFQRMLELDVELQPGDRIIIPFGTNEVFLTGEVKRSEWITVEPLTRLSEIVEGRLTARSSKRTIRVVSQNHEEQSYDLFLAERFGMIENDPYLQSGDRVVIDRTERRVEIRGEVERPGTYELLRDESFGDLVARFGGGVTENANTSSTEIVRYITDGETITEKGYFDLSGGLDAGIELRDLDSVYFPSKLKLMPYVFFEGAVNTGMSEEGVGTVLDTTSRFRYRFHTGELLSEALSAVENRFSPESDLAKAYVIRSDGEKIPIDMEALLQRTAGATNIELESNDQFIVPFKQYFVIVSGAVQNPGRYPYIPDRTFRYYVDLAGGYDSQLHVGNAVRIADIDGESLRPTELIEPETKITAPINNPLYYVNQLSGVIGVIGTIISIVALVTGG